MSNTPPSWAEAWLRMLLPERDRETVSGDLLEEYRDTVRPARGRLRADAWYVAQVGWFTWRCCWACWRASRFWAGAAVGFRNLTDPWAVVT